MTTMTANQMDDILFMQIERRTGVQVTASDASKLRRAALTLQRWAEAECGDSGPTYSWAIERDEETGKPYRCIYPHEGTMRRYLIPDRERGALRTVAAICAEYGLHFYHQTDPRGCSLYVGAEPLTDANYNHGVACCA